MAFKLLPPPKDACQECAVQHEPEQAHNKDSMYYQYWFYSKHGRWPVWKDAIAHCPPDVKEHWEREIRKAGAWKEPGPVEACPMDDGTIGTVTTIPIEEEEKNALPRRPHPRKRRKERD